MGRLSACPRFNCLHLRKRLQIAIGCCSVPRTIRRGCTFDRCDDIFVANTLETIEAGLRRIRARRRRNWYFAIAIPFIAAPLIFLSALYRTLSIAYFAIPTFIALVFIDYMQLRWSRCPRCAEYFFGTYSPSDPLDMRQHEDKCQNRGLALYDAASRDSFS
jgi:hypothetical protein